MSGFIEHLHHYEDGVHHRSFKLSADHPSHVKEPHHILLIAASIMAILINAHVLYWYSTSQQEPVRTPAVLGETTSREVAEHDAYALEAYQTNVQLIISAYILNRTAYLEGFRDDSITPEQLSDWGQRIDEAEGALLEMRVASRFQELHIRLASALAAERASIAALYDQSLPVDDGVVSDSTGHFRSIIQDYPWLNN